MSIVKVGIGVIVFKDYHVLLGKRKNSHGENTWGFPGGHLEFNENPIDCAVRETKEETGIEIVQIEKGPWSNDIFSKDQKHYITLFMLAKYKQGDLQVLEPEKCLAWEWVKWGEWPGSLFLPIQNLINDPKACLVIENYLAKMS